MKKMMQWYRNLKFRKKVWLCMSSSSDCLGNFCLFPVQKSVDKSGTENDDGNIEPECNSTKWKSEFI